MSVTTISPTVQRRFILGRQGLWPGRRWSGHEGTDQALRAVEAVQIDPVSVVAESHDIALWGRVLDYQPAHLRTLAYEERQFFDYGGALFFYPMSELPYWRGLMDWHKENGRWSEFMQEHPALLDQVRAELRERGPLRNRDFDGKKVEAYRSSKDTGLALYAMWISGELMTYGRQGKERIFGFRENIAPAHLHEATVPEADAEAYFLRKMMAEQGLINGREIRAALQYNLRRRPVTIQEAQAVLDDLMTAGQIEALQVSGQKEIAYHLAADNPHIEALSNNEIPPDWQPLGPTTEQEVTFLTPLERVSARGRAKKLFEFDYIWEIYKPDTKRVYGPYTLPILYGDRLVARLDSRLDRSSKTLILNGLWLEEWFEADAAFAEALAAGLARFAAFLGAEQIDSSSLDAGLIRHHL